MYKKIFFKTDYATLLNATYNESRHCLSPEELNEFEATRKKFGLASLPKTYIPENTTIYQRFWKHDELDFDNIGKDLKMEIITISTIKQPPGNIIPLHVDSYYQTKKEFPNSKKTLVRANIYLQDWQWGHFIQYENEVKSHWQQGEGVMSDDQVLHLSCNAGLTDKFTMQVSGFLRKWWN